MNSHVTFGKINITNNSDSQFLNNSLKVNDIIDCFKFGINNFLLICEHKIYLFYVNFTIGKIDLIQNIEKDFNISYNLRKSKKIIFKDYSQSYLWNKAKKKFLILSKDNLFSLQFMSSTQIIQNLINFNQYQIVKYL